MGRQHRVVVRCTEAVQTVQAVRLVKRAHAFAACGRKQQAAGQYICLWGSKCTRGCFAWALGGCVHMVCALRPAHAHCTRARMHARECPHARMHAHRLDAPHTCAHACACMPTGLMHRTRARMHVDHAHAHAPACAHTMGLVCYQSSARQRQGMTWIPNMEQAAHRRTQHAHPTPSQTSSSTDPTPSYPQPTPNKRTIRPHLRKRRIQPAPHPKKLQHRLSYGACASHPLLLTLVSMVAESSAHTEYICQNLC